MDWDGLKKLVIDCFTGKDNSTLDIGRVSFAIVLLFYIGMEVADVIMTHTFEAKDWAEGVAIIFGAVGVHLYLKKGTEPE